MITHEDKQFSGQYLKHLFVKLPNLRYQNFLISLFYKYFKARNKISLKSNLKHITIQKCYSIHFYCINICMGSENTEN